MLLPKLHIAIPLLDELDNIQQLLSDLKKQSYTNVIVWICVNQPESWHENPLKRIVCSRNKQTLEILQKQTDLPLQILDFSSQGKGWTGKNIGVGMARKVLMDAISVNANPEDIIVSLDGDTEFNVDYFHSIATNFYSNPEIPAISVPYYHRLTGKEAEDRAILRYEIYMRYYLYNLQRIRSPYSFTALGSAMACRVSVYRRIGGMTPKKSGEDFYFLQKISKFKPISTFNSEWVFPAARFSNRVFFGTGPAMIKGAYGDWSSYPIYRWELFDDIKKSFEAFPDLFKKDFTLPIDRVLELGWAQKLRSNAKSKEVFIKACHEKFDGLRTLQYLKEIQLESSETDERNLLDFALEFRLKELQYIIKEDFSFKSSPLETINRVRNYFTTIGITTE